MRRRSSAGDPADELGLKLPRPLACGGDVQRLGRGGRHNHALTERDPRRRRRALLAEVRFLAVLAEIEPGELLPHAGLGAERGLHQSHDHDRADHGEGHGREHGDELHAHLSEIAGQPAVTLPERRKSTKAQVTSAAAAAVLVLVNASAAKPFAARADPALNPNQPNHNRPAPRSTSGTLCGTIAVRLKSLRAPSRAAATSAETPELMCTTVPPAKSSAPSFCSQPPAPQTQCARGSYTNVDQRSRNTTYARNRIRSAMAPEISAGVMIANISWNMACACSGIVAA